MKYVISVLSVIGIVLVLVFCPLKQESSPEYLRVHIRANSNSVVDQNVKYKVKDEVVESLIPILAEVDDFEEAKRTADKLNKDLVKIKIPMDKENPGEKLVPVTINGWTWTIMRGETVEVPEAVAKILEDANYI